MDQLNRSRAILFAGILLGGYIVLLIGLVYVGQQHLRQSLYDQAHLALEKQAAAVGYFITEQQGEVGELAGSSILDSFFANRALGMSMQYGLRASLLAVRDELERLRQRKQLHSCKGLPCTPESALWTKMVPCSSPSGMQRINRKNSGLPVRWIQL
ncbi:hypothetical protein [Thiolapillus sp.]|uniref:hypothetical protein n=1 Tax=Thiolapillus sp. TaxID=2017437 RepID=UPI003AF9CAF6